MTTNDQEKKSLRCGVVAIVGRPNVGKSTLLNGILGEKVAIVSSVPQTTRQQIRGIYNDERGQIVFIDTPGVHLAKDTLGKWMNASSSRTGSDADCIIHLVDSSEPTGQEESMVMDQLGDFKNPIIVGLNKIDLKGKYVDHYIAIWEKAKEKPFHEIENMTLLPISGKTSFNIDKLLNLLFAILPEGPLLYPTDTLSDLPQRVAIADIIREKLFWLMREEVPHSLAVIIKDIVKRKKNLLYIPAVILVERDSQKEIVIGKKGQILKEVGTAARKELEDLMGQKIFLELFVKTEKNWRDNPGLLNEMGFLI